MGPENEPGASHLARPSSVFSLRRNLRRLFSAPAHRLRPLDGIRALSILWVVVFHAGWYIGQDIPVTEYMRLVWAPSMVPIWRGHFGVDVFFVLSGFLIAGMLLDERAETGKIHLLRFYSRRLIRLWPALLVAALLAAILLHDHPERLWANVLYISNFIPILHATMGWTWSLATEEQFYLVCPWLLLAISAFTPRGRVTALLLLMLALIGVGAWVAAIGRFDVHDMEIVIDRDIRAWARAFDHLYDKPWMRAGPLLAGVAAAILARSARVMDFFGRRTVLSAVLFVAALALGYFATDWPIAYLAPRKLEILFMASHRTLFGAAAAYVLLLSISKNKLGRALGWALSARWLYPIGQLAYSAYLLNPIMTTLVDHALAPVALKYRLPPFPLFLPFDALATFGAAALLYLLVERPFMDLRDRLRFTA